MSNICSLSGAGFHSSLTSLSSVLHRPKDTGAASSWGNRAATTKANCLFQVLH